MDSNSTSLTLKDAKILTDLNLIKDVKIGSRRRMLGWDRYFQYAEKKFPAKDMIAIAEFKKELERQKMVLVSALEEEL